MPKEQDQDSKSPGEKIGEGIVEVLFSIHDRSVKIRDRFKTLPWYVQGFIIVTVTVLVEDSVTRTVGTAVQYINSINYGISPQVIEGLFPATLPLGLSVTTWIWLLFFFLMIFSLPTSQPVDRDIDQLQERLNRIEEELGIQGQSDDEDSENNPSD